MQGFAIPIMGPMDFLKMFMRSGRSAKSNYGRPPSPRPPAPAPPTYGNRPAPAPAPAPAPGPAVIASGRAPAVSAPNNYGASWFRLCISSFTL